jgi:hypothetical protein
LNDCRVKGLLNTIGKLTFIQVKNERQLSRVGTCCLNGSFVVVSGLAAFGRKKPKADVWDRWRDDSFAPKSGHCISKVDMADLFDVADSPFLIPLLHLAAMR